MLVSSIQGPSNVSELFRNCLRTDPSANCILQKSELNKRAPKVDLLVRVTESVHFNAFNV